MNYFYLILFNVLLKKLNKMKTDKFEQELAIELAPEQKAAIVAVTQNSVVIITGGPGVGKTTIVRAILRIFERARLQLRLAAPTGRAAKRLSETTKREA